MAGTFMTIADINDIFPIDIDLKCYYDQKIILFFYGFQNNVN